MTPVAPSGQQFEIRHGDQHAVIVEVGGGIRAYEDAGRPVLDPYPVDRMCDGAHGAPLNPWPNRLGDGRYRFDGTDYQVALTEPDKGNAIHGFLRWRSWQAREHTDSRVVMGTRLHPLKGYPFVLDVEIAYQLGDDGLTVSTTAFNGGEAACPYGAGQHPYLSPGEGRIDDCVVHLDAATRFLTDNPRQLPEGREPVEGTAYDFRQGRRIGDLKLDYSFTDLSRDGDGRAWVKLASPDGTTAAVWVDEHYPIVELFSGDTLSPDRRRRGLGSEPMTCPPNAFQTGDDVIRLEPGEAVTTTWGALLVT
jgi:aldose 1-epimerase